MRVTVEPAPDGYDMRGNWVTRKGGTSRPSTKKSAALRKARNLASEGDTLIVKRTDGTVATGYPRRYRGNNSRADTTTDTDTSRDTSTTPAADTTPDAAAGDLPDYSFRDPVDTGVIVDDDFDDTKDEVGDSLDDLF